MNSDPLRILRRQFDRWIPVGGTPKFKLKMATEREIAGYIKDLKNSQAYGIDKMDAVTVKLGAQFLVPVITHVINLSLESEIFPSRWKLARVLPLLKGRESDPLNPASFRPASQLPVVAKLAERTVQRQLLKYLEESELLSPNHHAYRSDHNTSTALLQMIDTIATATDDNKITATVNIDLTAAFDCVHHATLMNKLEFYGIDSRTTNWIRSYLDSRSSFVSIGSATSRIYNTPHGVPQGSVLGPLLYLLYVNEMTSIAEDPDCANPVHRRTDKLFTEDCHMCGIFPMYADDGQLQISTHNRDENQDIIEKHFWNVVNFLNAHGLQVNQSKTRITEFMTYQKRTRLRGIPPDITVEEETVDRQGVKRTQSKLITESRDCKILGLTLRNNLNWESHLHSGKGALLPALRRQLGMITRISHNMSTKARLNLVNCLVMSRMSYMICAWGNTSQNHLKKVQIVQNTAGRLVTGLSRYTKQSVIIENCKWLNIAELTEYQSLCQAWKTVRWNLPRHFKDRMILTDDQRIETNEPRLLITAQSYRWKTVGYWNALPENLRYETTLTRFKKQLKKWLRERIYDPGLPPDDSLEELPPDDRNEDD